MPHEMTAIMRTMIAVMIESEKWKEMCRTLKSEKKGKQFRPSFSLELVMTEVQSNMHGLEGDTVFMTGSSVN